IEGTVTEKDGGSLPNTDSYHWFMSQGHLQDLLTVGAVLGELGVLTKKSRQTRATCETDVR
ncbi:sodium/hydrogen exchanger 10 isoform X2, partial [Ixodes scapularis]